MESKQNASPVQNAKTNAAPPLKTANEISGQLADIELKLDHIIESIKDSLHKMNLEKTEDSP